MIVSKKEEITMKTAQKSGLVLIVAFLAFQGTVFAETLSGKVESVDPAQNTFSLSRPSIPDATVNETLNISVGTETTYSGIVSLSDLKTGAEVSVDAQSGTDGKYSATSVSAAVAAPKAAM